MKISIAMATYNGEKYLQEQLDSFISQIRQPDELVVCDDCSTDNTMDILKNFQEKASFAVHVHRNDKNLGFIKNFEQALTFCTGGIIFLSDQDDIWFEDKLSSVEEAFNNNPATMVIINDCFVSDEACKKRLFSKLSNVNALGLSENAYVMGCATALRTEFLTVALPIPQSIRSHDLWLNHLAIFSGTRMILRRQLQLYRRHAGSTTINSFGANKRILLPMLVLLRQFGIKDSREGWREEIVWNSNYIERLRIAPSIENSPQMSSEHLARSIHRLSNKNAAIRKRIDLMEFGKPQRLFRVIRLWISGFYDQFEGWKSAIKDSLR